MAEVVVLDLMISPFGLRVRIALAEKGIDFEWREEDLRNKSDLLLKMNPVNKKIPVLIHKGRPVCESLNIVEYIDEVWNHKPRLLPDDPLQRANARFWANYVDQKIYSRGRPVCEATGEVQETAKKELIECFKVLEGELGEKTYFGGESFGIVDVSLIPYYTWFYAWETIGNIRFAEECPKLVEWAERCMQRESVAKFLPDQQKLYDFFMEHKKEHGKVQ